MKEGALKNRTGYSEKENGKRGKSRSRVLFLCKACHGRGRRNGSEMLGPQGQAGFSQGTQNMTIATF